jgi:phenolic acid decarboxylase
MKNEKEMIKRVVEMFSQKMKAKMLLQYEDGWQGWNDIVNEFEDGIPYRINNNIQSGDWIDVANLAMIKWNLERKRKLKEAKR